MKKIIKILIVIVAVSGLAFVAYNKAESRKGLEVKVMTPGKGVMTSLISATGKVVSGQESEVASPIASKVIKVLVKEGQKVSQGSLLVVLDARDASNRIGGDKATVGEARAKVEQAERALRSLQKVYEVGGASLSSVQDAELQVKVAQAAEMKAATELRSSSLMLERYRIVAPFSGIIVKKSVQVGDVVAVGTSLLSLANMATTEIEISVDESDAGSLQVGQEVEVSCEALANRSWKETILRIERVVHKDGTANTVKTRVSLSKNVTELRLGQQVDAKIKIAEKSGVLKLPFDALIVKDGKKFVATVRTGKVHLEPVVTGLEDTNSVEIVSPARLDEEVILSEGKTLLEGQKVSVTTRINK